MTPKLRALLLAVGTIAAAGGVLTVYVPRMSVSRADLADAGVTLSCNLRRLACTTLEDLDGGGQAYRQRTVDVAICPDGIIVPRAFARAAADYGVHDLMSQCHLVRNVSQAEFSMSPGGADPSDCACAPYPDAGNCRLRDGGSLNGNTAQPGTWVGSSCLEAACVEVFGTRGTPPGCAP